MGENTDTGDTVQVTATTTTTGGATTLPVREDLITKAVSFLQNPKVVRSGLNQKQHFLRTKGLREDEIQIACERAGVFTDDPNQIMNESTIVNVDRYRHGNVHHQVQPQPYYGKLAKIKDYLSTVALISGITYAIYLFYKRFIEPFLFGRKKKTIDESLDEINSKVDKNHESLNVELKNFRDEIKENAQVERLSRDLQSFKSDLDAIKGLLLNRKQFSSPLPNVSAPSIPAWQLNTQQQRKTSENSDKNDETGSGSGSSETEVVPLDQNQW